MEIYSYSKLSTFEQCPLKYKFRYIDKIIIPEKTIESLLGKIIHKALEWLYLEVKNGVIPSLDDVLLFYTKKWQEEDFSNGVIMNGNLTLSDYYNRGIQLLTNYYFKHKPFDDNTLDVEKEIIVSLDEFKNYLIRGFIDRLAYNLKTCEYEIHDYKTSNFLPSREKISNDKQLALYSFAIKKMFGENKGVLLVWHYLAHNLKISLKKTNDEIYKLKEETIDLIKKIKSTKNFSPCVSRFCNWCEYKKICPAFGGKPPKTQPIEKITEKQDKQEILDIWD